MQIIEANLNGELNLKIETELVCVTTHFKDLGNPPLGKFPGMLYFACDKLFRWQTILRSLDGKEVNFGWLCFRLRKGTHNGVESFVTALWWKGEPPGREKLECGPEGFLVPHLQNLGLGSTTSKSPSSSSLAVPSTKNYSFSPGWSQM